MTRLRLTIPVCVLIAAIAASASAAAPASAPATTQSAATQPFRPTLFAYGSSDQYWIASVESYREGTKTRFKTFVRQQTLPAGDWKDLGVVYGHATALAEVNGELALLLEDGSWKRLGEAGLSTGPTVPGAGQVLAWGSASSTLYAIRAVEGGPDAVTTRPVEPTSRPSGAPGATTRAFTLAPAASQPSIRPLTLALLRYERGQWVGVSELPPGTSTAANFALAAAGNKPLLAVSSDRGVVHTFTWVDFKWEDDGDVRATARTSDFGLLTVSHLAALWTIDPDGGMTLFLKHEGESWSPAKAFVLPAVPQGAQRALAAAGEEFRLVFLKEGKFWEQRYDANGSPLGGLNELRAPQTNHADPIIRILYSILLLGMVVVMLVTFYRRRATIEKKDDEQ
jgi:hypothetical protein